LTKAWQQSPLDVLALNKYNNDPEEILTRSPEEKLAALLGLSLLSTRQLYFAENMPCNESQSYIKSALTLLNMSLETLTNIQQQSATYCHTYSTLY
jgi:hypothetical protein